MAATGHIDRYFDFDEDAAGRVYDRLIRWWINWNWQFSGSSADAVVVDGSVSMLTRQQPTSISSSVRDDSYAN